MAAPTAAAPSRHGYYPRGNKYFSDLLHYVRSGEFVTAMLETQRTSISTRLRWGRWHIIPPTIWAPTVNQIVAIEFPKLKAKY